MKYIYMPLFLFFSLVASGQKKALTLVKLASGSTETISALKDRDNGLRTLQIPIIVSVPNKKPTLQEKITINVKLLDYNHTSSKPVLITSEALVFEYDNPALVKNIAFNSPLFITDSTKWEAKAECVIQLKGKTLRPESIYIIQTEDIENSHQINIAPDLTIIDSSAIDNNFKKMANGQACVAVTGGSVANAAKNNTPATKKICHFTLDNYDTLLSANYNRGTIKLDTINLRIIRDTILSAGQTDTVNFIINKSLFPFEIKLQNNSVIINKWDIKGSLIYKDTFLVFENITLPDTLKKSSPSAYISVDCDKTTFHAVQLGSSPKKDSSNYTPDVPFWAEIGTNFDLVDKIQAQNIYGGIFMFENDIVRFVTNSTRTKFNSISFTGGVYETKSTSLTSTSDSGIVYRNGQSFIHTADGFPYYRDTGSVATTSNVTSIGIFLSPHLSLNNLPTESNGFHWYLSIYAEMLWQRVNSSYDYSKTGRDTTYYLSTTDSVNRYNYKEASYNNDYRSHYVGLGLPVYIKDYDPKNRWRFSLYVNPVFGLSTQKFIALQSPLDSSNRHYDVSYLKQTHTFSNPLTNTFAAPTHNWNPFYLLQFRLNEEKIGVSFTGEVRGFFLQGSKPIISLSLSKKFDIGAFYNSITKAPASSAAATTNP